MTQDCSNFILMQTGNFLYSWCVVEVKLGSLTAFSNILVKIVILLLRKFWDIFSKRIFFLLSPLPPLRLTHHQYAPDVPVRPRPLPSINTHLTRLRACMSLPSLLNALRAFVFCCVVTIER